MSRLHFLKVAILSVLHRTLSRGSTTTPSAAPQVPTTSSSEASTASSSTDLWRLSRCLAEVETGNNDRAVGTRGELSRYQIGREVWYQHNPDLNFILACNGVRAEYTALRHLSWLRDHLATDHPEWLAYAWQHGLSATFVLMEEVREMEFKRPLSDYTERVANLYYDPTFQPQPLDPTKW